MLLKKATVGTAFFGFCLFSILVNRSVVAMNMEFKPTISGKQATVAAALVGLGAYLGYKYMQSPSVSLPEGAGEPAIEPGVRQVPEVSVAETIALFKRGGAMSAGVQELLNNPVLFDLSKDVVMSGLVTTNYSNTILNSPDFLVASKLLSTNAGKATFKPIARAFKDENLGLEADFKMACISQSLLPEDSAQKIMVVLDATIRRSVSDSMQRSRVIEAENQFVSITTITPSQEIIQKTRIIMPRDQFRAELDRAR